MTTLLAPPAPLHAGLDWIGQGLPQHGLRLLRAREFGAAGLALGLATRHISLGLMILTAAAPAGVHAATATTSATTAGSRSSATW